MISHWRKVMWAGCRLAQHDFTENNLLPWRQDRTPYRIFLAEMMLVRTRADVVIKLFEAVFEKYPDINTLADANLDELTETLKPLGLKKRTPYLIKAAQYIRDKYSSEIPENVVDLIKVPGLGDYTAPAIATFAYQQTYVPSDVNINRFISRLTGLEMEHKTKGSKEIRALLPYLSETHIGLSAENLLDFTRKVCHPRTPHCRQCPLTRFCDYFQQSNEV